MRGRESNRSHLVSVCPVRSRPLCAERQRAPVRHIYPSESFAWNLSAHFFWASCMRHASAMHFSPKLLTVVDSTELGIRATRLILSLAWRPRLVEARKRSLPGFWTPGPPKTPKPQPQLPPLRNLRFRGPGARTGALQVPPKRGPRLGGLRLPRNCLTLASAPLPRRYFSGALQAASEKASNVSPSPRVSTSARSHAGGGRPRPLHGCSRRLSGAEAGRGWEAAAPDSWILHSEAFLCIPMVIIFGGLQQAGRFRFNISECRVEFDESCTALPRKASIFNENLEGLLCC